MGAQRAFVQRVAQDAEREDCQGQGVHAAERFAPRQLGDDVRRVFEARGGVPEERVEEDASRGDCGCQRWSVGVEVVSMA